MQYAAFQCRMPANHHSLQCANRVQQAPVIIEERDQFSPSWNAMTMRVGWQLRSVEASSVEVENVSVNRSSGQAHQSLCATLEPKLAPRQIMAAQKSFDKIVKAALETA
jgi:hypothetical protein